ncbi:MAG: KamA family radical SAM protein [Chloroflexota bacterium]
MGKVRYVNRLSLVPQLPPEEARELEKVAGKFPFGANSYYLGLIDWNDPADPIRRIVIPSPEELEDWGHIDPSSEARYTVAPGLEHMYPDTALFLLSDSCGGHCRYCFRKRLFMADRERETLKDYRPAVEYIRAHPEVNNILLTGGDPLRLKTSDLREVIAALRKIEHVQIVRIGTRMPVFNPFRVIDDADLPKMVREFSTPEKRMYFMLHFCHPREITKEAIEAVSILLESGAILCNQNPLVRGVNDSPVVLAELFNKLSFIGVSPYYTFQMRPAIGNKPFAVPLVRAYQVFQQARARLSGTAKRATFVMSHAIGKIEVVGLDDSFIYLRHHRAPNPEDCGRLIIAWRNDTGYWLEDFEAVSRVLPSDDEIAVRYARAKVSIGSS